MYDVVLALCRYGCWGVLVSAIEPIDAFLQVEPARADAAAVT